MIFINDIIVDYNNIRFNYRVALIIDGVDKCLFATHSEDDYLYLIGGRCKYGESSIETIIRETKEELGIIINENELKLINVSENFFNGNGKNYHELLFIYVYNANDELLLKDNIPTLDKNWIINKWIKKDELDNYEIKPNIVKGLIYKNLLSHNIIKE